MATPVSPSRTARAEARRTAELAQQERARTAAETRYAEEHRRSEVQAQAARMGVMSGWPGLRASIGWFKREWQAALTWAMHEGYQTVEPDDLTGAPALNERWRSYLYGKPGTGDVAEPIRVAMSKMATSQNRYERCASAFLFTMACMDFDPVAAGLAVKDHCLCDAAPDETPGARPHADTRACVMRILPLAPEYAPYYAMQAIERLRERVVQVMQRPPRALDEPEWKRRIGKSESQHAAEDAA